MTVQYGIAHTFDVGTEVEVLIDRTSRTTWQDGAWKRDLVDVWRRAVIEKFAPYHGQPGYYVRYPDAKEQWECGGGWQPEHLVRVKTEAA